MNDTANRNKFSEDALSEVTGGRARTAPVGPPHLGASKIVERSSADAPQALGEVVDFDSETVRTPRKDVNSFIREGDTYSDPNAPAQQLLDKSASESGTFSVEGSKTAFDNFFEKLWWNINRLFR